MSKPRLLDLFCGAGGAGMGYARAGFEVVGVDIHPQPHYPFEFHQADAMTYPLDGFDAIHASPPCQDYSEATAMDRSHGKAGAFPRLINPMRRRLQCSGLLWVIENVDGARRDMVNPLMLCGTSLGLHVWRHRRFESNIMLFGAGPCQHRSGDVSITCYKSDYIGVLTGAAYETQGQIRHRRKHCLIADARGAMGIDWKMTQHELGESIPPAYTEWLGRQLLAAIGADCEVA